MNKRQSLGQHFLVSNSVAKSIVDYADIKKNDTVLEVGTGKGILTPHLCKKAKKVISIEKDLQLYQDAMKRFGNIPNLVLESGDAFKTNAKFDVFVSNLPYSESRRAMEWLARQNFSHGVVMVQREFAQKILQREKKEKRAISTIVNYSMEIRQVMDVRRSEFQPPPRVDSVVLSIVHKNRITGELVKTINKLFSFKRKTIRQIGRRFGLQIDSNDRLEDISDREIVGIAKQIV